MRYCFALCLGLLVVLSNQAWARDVARWPDPDYLPFSNRAGEGFENKVAVLVARDFSESGSSTLGGITAARADSTNFCRATSTLASATLS